MNTNNIKKGCAGCPYLEQKRINGVRMTKETLIVMLCPGKNEKKNGIPLSSNDNRSATKRIEKCLPQGRTLEDYAVTELVKCYPSNDSVPDSIAVALCYKYLEEDLCKNSFKKVIVMCKEGIPIVTNIKERNNLDFDIVEGKHPRSGVDDNTLKSYFL